MASLLHGTGLAVPREPASCQLFELAERVAKADVSVFINGPTGSGKEVLSNFIHNNSNRDGRQFVAINCAAIPENMLEAMLFGHEKGSFTGASTANVGIIRAADGGTLLLDEVSEMSLSSTSKASSSRFRRKRLPRSGELSQSLLMCGFYRRLIEIWSLNVSLAGSEKICFTVLMCFL